MFVSRLKFKNSSFCRHCSNKAEIDQITKQKNFCPAHTKNINMYTGGGGGREKGGPGCRKFLEEHLGLAYLVSGILFNGHLTPITIIQLVFSINFPYLS